MGFGYDDTVFHHRRDIVLVGDVQLAARRSRPCIHRILQENLSWRGSTTSLARLASERRLDLQEDRRRRRRPAR